MPSWCKSAPFKPKLRFADISQLAFYSSSLSLAPVGGYGRTAKQATPPPPALTPRTASSKSPWRKRSKTWHTTTAPLNKHPSLPSAPSMAARTNTPRNSKLIHSNPRRAIRATLNRDTHRSSKVINRSNKATHNSHTLSNSHQWVTMAAPQPRDSTGKSRHNIIIFQAILPRRQRCRLSIRLRSSCLDCVLGKHEVPNRTDRADLVPFTRRSA